MESARYGTNKEEKQEGYEERREHVEGKKEGKGGEEERTGMTRKRRGIRDFVCLPVRPSEPEGTSAAANLEEELGRETNTSAGETTTGKEGDSILRIVG